MRALFPYRLLLRGPGNTAEMLTELENILSRFTDVFAEPEMDDVSTECGPTPCFEPVSPAPRLVTSLDVCANRQGCEVSSFTLTEDSNILVRQAYGDKDILLYSGQDGTLLDTYTFEFAPEGMAYLDHVRMFVERTNRNERQIYQYNTSSGQLTELMSISDGISSYGMEVLDGMLFIGGQYGSGMHVYLLNHSRVVEIYSLLCTLCPTEPGSKYGLFTGQLVQNENEMVLSTSVGEKICPPKPLYRYHSTQHGVVSRDGTFYLPGDGGVVRYNKRCEPDGMFPIPGVDKSISGLDIQNGKLYVHKQNGQFAVYQI